MNQYPEPNPKWKDFPQLFQELNLEKNLDLTYNGKPIHVFELSPGTDKMLDWKCSECGHEWKARGAGRRKGWGCLACNNREVHIDGRNSMAVTHPKFAAEYQGDAGKVVAGTSKRLNWKCSKCEHIWCISPNQRISGGLGCPACTNKEIHSDGRNSMAVTHPKFAAEYQGDASLVVAGTDKKLDWKCSTCDHEWKTSGHMRVGGTGCPSCANRAIHSDGRNSMAVTHPKLAAEYQGDATLVKAGTHKKLDWKCSTCDHEWKAMSKPRMKGVGCPACSGRVVHTDGRNSMAVTHPKLAAEYQGDATLVKAGTHKKLDWKCSTCEHEWKAPGAYRRLGAGCPNCIVPTKRTHEPMATTHPKLAAEYQRDATLVKAGTSKKLDWKCSTCEHEWKATGGSRRRGSGCPACVGKAIHIDGRNSMAVTHPLLAAEYQGDATKVFAKTSSKHKWKCSTCEHEWEAAGGNRVLFGHGCPACAGQEIHKDGRNSMAVTHPKLAAEYQGDASLVLAGTHKKLDWICSTCDHEWKTTGAHRTNRGHGCPACAGQEIHKDGRNSMAVTHPKLAAEYQGDASLVLAGTHKKLDWICSTCDHEWKSTGNKRSVRGDGCRACDGKALHSAGRNSMAVTHPELAAEYQGDATLVIAGTNDILDWKCSTCDHEWKTQGSNRRLGSGCLACRNLEIHIDGRNSMAVTHPELAAEYQGDATLVVAGTNDKLDWKCSTCDHEWKTTGANRRAGRGCPACAIFGFQPHLPAYYYVNEILNEVGDRLYFKGGISLDYERRLKELSQDIPNHMVIRNVEELCFEIGQDALELETRLLNVSKREGWKAPNREFDGGTELFLINPLEYAREQSWI